MPGDRWPNWCMPGDPAALSAGPVGLARRRILW